MALLQENSSSSWHPPHQLWVQRLFRNYMGVRDIGSCSSCCSGFSRIAFKGKEVPALRSALQVDTCWVRFE